VQRVGVTLCQTLIDIISEGSLADPRRVQATGLMASDSIDLFSRKLKRRRWPQEELKHIVFPLPMFTAWYSGFPEASHHVAPPDPTDKTTDEN
jgi:hypothetical protein